MSISSRKCIVSCDVHNIFGETVSFVYKQLLIHQRNFQDSFSLKCIAKDETEMTVLNIQNRIKFIQKLYNQILLKTERDCETQVQDYAICRRSGVLYFNLFLFSST